MNWTLFGQTETEPQKEKEYIIICLSVRVVIHKIATGCSKLDVLL
jgi:hypothetical protein